MKFIVATLLSALLAFAGGLFFDWWIIAITSFIVGVLIQQRAFIAFIAGFIGVAALWGGLAFYIDMQNHHLLASKIASVLPLHGSAVVLIMVTSFIGGLVSGFAALTGSFLREKRRRRNVDDYVSEPASKNYV
jgi:hypothetical protein